MEDDGQLWTVVGTRTPELAVRMRVLARDEEDGDVAIGRGVKGELDMEAPAASSIWDHFERAFLEIDIVADRDRLLHLRRGLRRSTKTSQECCVVGAHALKI